MNWINFPRFKIEEEKQPKKKESNMTMEEFARMIILTVCFALAFAFGRWSGLMDMKEKLQDKQTELNICVGTIDLFKEDLDAFCAERFEKMGC